MDTGIPEFITQTMNMLHNCLQYPQRPPLNQSSLLTQLSRRLLFRNDTPETLSTPQSRLTVVAFLHRAPTPNLLWVPCGEEAQPCSVCRTIVFLAGDLCGLSSQGQSGSLQQPPPHRGDVSLHSGLTRRLVRCAAAAIIHVLSMWIVAYLLCIIWDEKTSDWHHEQHW